MKKMTRRIAGIAFGAVLAFTIGAGVYSVCDTYDQSAVTASAESNVTVLETKVSDIDGTYGKTDQVISFYLTENDYDETGENSDADRNFLNSINFYDYIELDGVKLSAISGYQGQIFYNVWGRKGSFSTRWPESMNKLDGNEGTTDDVQEIKLLEGCQFPAVAENTVYELKETQIFLRQDNGSFADKASLLGEDDVQITAAEVAGDADELYEVTISAEGWKFSKGEYDYNYDGYIATRNSIKINGVGLADINQNTDDSGYVYSTGPMNQKEGLTGVWTDPKDAWKNPVDVAAGKPLEEQRDLFANPVMLRAPIGGNTMVIYIHKNYVESLCKNFGDKLVLTVGKGYGESGKALEKDISVTVYEIGYDLTLMDGEKEIATISKAAGTSFDTVAAPQGADHYLFAGWVDADGNPAPAVMPESTLTLYASWKPAPYTLTIINIDGSEKTFSFGIEYDRENGIEYVPADLEELLNKQRPAATEEHGYGYVESIPFEFRLKDYTFTLTTVQSIFTITFTDKDGKDIGVAPITFTEETLYTLVLPEVPAKEGYKGAWNKTIDRLRLEDVTLIAEYTEIKETPKQPTTPDTDSDADVDVDDSSADENKGFLGNITSKIPGCGGVIGGIAGGVAALGVAVVALFKKKED